MQVPLAQVLAAPLCKWFKGPAVCHAWRQPASFQCHAACDLITYKPRAHQNAACRRQGVGRALLDRLLEQAAGADVLLTTITRRIGFYTGAGFRRLDLKEVPGCARLNNCMHHILY